MHLTSDDMVSKKSPPPSPSTLDTGSLVVHPLLAQQKGGTALLNTRSRVRAKEAADALKHSQGEFTPTAQIIASISGAQRSVPTVIDGKDPAPVEDDQVSVISISDESDESDDEQGAISQAVVSRASVSASEASTNAECSDVDDNGAFIGQPSVNISKEDAPHPFDLKEPIPSSKLFSDHQVVLYGPCVGIFTHWFTVEISDEDLVGFRTWNEAFDYYRANFEIDQVKIIKPIVKAKSAVTKGKRGPLSVDATPKTSHQRFFEGMPYKEWATPTRISRPLHKQGTPGPSHVRNLYPPGLPAPRLSSRDTSSSASTSVNDLKGKNKRSAPSFASTRIKKRRSSVEGTTEGDED